MVSDELSAPLGLDPPGARRRPFRLRRLVAVSAAAIAAVVIGWAMLVDDPRGGQPSAVAEVAPMPVVAGPSGGGLVEMTPAGKAAAAPGEPALTEVAAMEAQPASGEVIIRDASHSDSPALSAVPLEDLLEGGKDGAIPRIGPDGTRPMEAYARPVDSAVANGTARIAIVVGGLGISSRGTEQAIGQLPPDVTLAFAPYGADLQRYVTQARQSGHEILLQLPLEPFDYPNNDPGPHTLLAGSSPAENAKRLHWLLARFGAYVGVVNYMGARFTAEPNALQPLMAEIAGRGLLYLDDGSSSRSQAAAVAGTKTPFARADIVIDATPSGSEIDDRLLQLEALARDRGVAIGVASAYPVSVDRIVAWARSAADRGVVLVPVTALVSAARS